MWVFMKSTNSNMNRYVGKKCELITPRRKTDGVRVLYVCEPGNRLNWYFYTSTITSITRDADYDSGIEKMNIFTHNSVYTFYRNL